MGTLPDYGLGKVLVVVPRDAETGAWFHVNALRRHLPGLSTFDFLPAVREHGIRGAERLLERIIAERGIGTVMMTFWGDSFHFPVEFFMRLRQRAAFVIWALDDECYFDAHGKYYAQAADAVVTVDCFAVPAYARLGIPAVLYYTSHSKDFFYPTDVPRDIDVSFVGDCTKSDRRRLMAAIEAHGIRVQMYGLGSKAGFVRKPEMARIFSRTKVNLNFTGMDPPAWLRDEDPILGRVRQNKGRPIEVALTRSFCLSEYAPSLPYFFDIGSEIGCFHDEAELVEKVRYYLSHDEEREAVSERAYRRALAEYEDDAYIPRVLGALKTILGRRDPPMPGGRIFLNHAFRRRQVASVFVQLAAALARGQMAIASQTVPRLFEHGVEACVKGVLQGASRALGIYREKLAGFHRPDPSGNYWK